MRQKVRWCPLVLNVGGSPRSLCLSGHRKGLLCVMSSGPEKGAGYWGDGIAGSDSSPLHVAMMWAM